MLRLRTYGFLTFASTPSPKRAKVDKFGFLNRVCMVFVVCGATAIASSAQIYGVLHNFGGGLSDPDVTLVQATDGNFYGTTAGTVFKMGPMGALTTLHIFSRSDGYYPQGLVQATDGNFYGTTWEGGTGSNCAYGGSYGTVFEMTPEGTLTTLHNFSGSDGGNPNGLVQGTDGNFYGTTWEGGTSSNCAYGGSCGTVFEMTPEGTLTTLHNFDKADGAYPTAALVQGTDGNFYGTTRNGGTSSGCYVGCGTVFKITPGGVLTTLYSFSGADGMAPAAALVQDRDGNFYGTTLWGGASYGWGDDGYGTVFKITPAGVLTTLYSFGISDPGLAPQAALVQATDGNFYGTTSGMGLPRCCGTIFRITPGGILSTLHSYERSSEYSPGPDKLVQATDGSFYGTTFRTDTIFRLRVFPAVRLSTTSLNFGSQALNEVSDIKTWVLKKSRQLAGEI